MLRAPCTCPTASEMGCPRHQPSVENSPFDLETASGRILDRARALGPLWCRALCVLDQIAFEAVRPLAHLRDRMR